MLVDVVMVVGHLLGAFVLEKLIKIVELRVDVRLRTRWFYFHEERIFDCSGLKLRVCWQYWVRSSVCLTFECMSQDNLILMSGATFGLIRECCQGILIVLIDTSHVMKL